MKSVYIKYIKTVATVWGVCFLIFLLFYLFVLLPQQKSKKKIEKQLAEEKQIYDAAVNASKLEYKSKFRKEIEQLQNKLRGFVADVGDSANLTFDISQVANKMRVGAFNIESKNNNRNSKMPNHLYIREEHINVSFNAGFYQFASLLNALERHQPVVFVDGFTVSRSDRTKSGHQMNMNLTVFVNSNHDGEEISKL